MDAGWVGLAFGAGTLLGPAMRGQVFHHSVADEDQPWRRDCPHCGRTLVRGWLPAVLPPTGRCPICLVRIGPPVAVVELVSALVLALLAWRIDGVLPFVAAAWMFTVGVVLVFVDIAVQRLPDRLTLAAAVGALLPLTLSSIMDSSWSRLGVAVLCGLGLAMLYLVLALIYPAGMGLGDAKTALAAGLITGWYGWFATAAGATVGFLLGGLYALALLVAGRAGLKDQLAHGPFLLAGAFTAVVLFG